MGKFLAGPGPWVRARCRHSAAVRFWKMVGEASARGPKVASEGGGKASPSRGGWLPGVFKGEREECLWSGQPAGRRDWAGTLDNTCSVPQLAVTFAKALDECTMPLPGASKPLALETHEEAAPWGAFTGRVVTWVPTRATLGLGPGQWGCQGPVLPAVRMHYLHLCSGTKASPVTRSHPGVDERRAPPASSSGFPPAPLGRKRQEVPGARRDSSRREETA